MLRVAKPIRKPGAGAPSLPSGFTDIRAVLDSEVELGKLVNIIGMVKDFRLPVKSKGTDYMCTITLFDLSTQDQNHAVSLHIFRPEADMPQVGARDIVVLFNVKVQQRGVISLISNRSSLIYIYTADKIPRFPKPADDAVNPDKQHKGKTRVDKEHHTYVSYFNCAIDKDQAPDVDEFNKNAAASMNIKPKFGLLKDVVEAKFYDLIVQVARQPWAVDDRVTMYVSDYTENPAFFHYTWEGAVAYDHYGYTTSDSPPNNEWVGPYGKRAIQITCWEPHSSWIISNAVSAGDWVHLRNVQIKNSCDGRILEGAMRVELGLDPNRINVEVLNEKDRNNMDPRLKDALRRWRDYEKKKNKQIKQIKQAKPAKFGDKNITTAAAAGSKREVTEDACTDEQPQRKLNAKERRKLKRAAIENQEEEKRANQDYQIALNDSILCENHSRKLSTIETMLEPPIYRFTDNGSPQEVALPFQCAKYRARVRVIDFYPDRLEDFACGLAPWDAAASSDDSESDQSLSNSDADDDIEARGHNRVWEWRFALKLEDAVPSKKGTSPSSLWVVVDNAEGQMLTNLDASNLRKNPNNLAQLRERLFTLWGDLEEKKFPKGRIKGSASTSRKTSPATDKKKKPDLERPSLDSSDEGDDGGDGNGDPPPGSPVSNRPFDCCIKQYGIRNKRREDHEADQDGDLPMENNADDVRDPNEEWMRVFALFGTQIRS